MQADMRMKLLSTGWRKISIVFGLTLLFSCSSFSAFAIANLPASECRPELIENPRLVKAGKSKSGVNKVAGKVSKFDPCHSSVSFKNPASKSPPLIILLHGGGGAKDVAAIDQAFLDMGMATLSFDAFKMNGFKKTPLINNWARQRMIWSISLGAYKWALKQSYYPVGDVFIYGISNGATVTTNLAGLIKPGRIKGFIAEGTSNGGAGMGLPNTLKNPLLMVYGELDNLATPIAKRRWNHPSPCSFNGLSKFMPNGTAENCNFVNAPDGFSSTIEDWAKHVTKIAKGKLDFKFIKRGAHCIMCEPLNIQTRAEFMKKINRKAPELMKTQGWSMGGDDNSKAELMNVIKAFITGS
jgi:predicted esterase